MIIDIDMHALPEGLFEDEVLLHSFPRVVPQAHGEFAKLVSVPGTDKKQIVIEKPEGRANLNFVQNAVDVKARLETMRKAGLDKAILRTPCWQERLSLEMCHQVNDSIARLVKQHPDKFLGLATILPWGDSGCLRELERCLDRLGLVGVELAAHCGNLYLDDPLFRPYFRKLNELNMPVVVHHTPLPADYRTLCEYDNLRRSMGRCISQMIAVGRELFSDLFEEYPNLKVIHTMLGGGFLHLRSKSFQGNPNKKKRSKDLIPRSLDTGISSITTCILTSRPRWPGANLSLSVRSRSLELTISFMAAVIRLDWIGC